MDATRPAGPELTILVVDDDQDIARLIGDALAPRDCRVLPAPSAAAAHAVLDRAIPDLILLDLSLPDADGLILYGDLKARADVPIIICSATSDQRDPILSLRLGADDFVPKPFRVDELEARIDAALERRAARAAGAAPAANGASGPAPAAPHSAAPLVVGELAIDHDRRQATLGGHLLPLTATEYRLLAALVQHADTVVTREELGTALWGNYDPALGRSIDVHVTHLRAKLSAGAALAAPAPNITVSRGFGYRLIPAPRAISSERRTRSLGPRRVTA
ncbi:MAG TPA: response regulator transcription factor [Chloroflexota bacterium]|nr:response regulator transcription factor [Chloroflexota bacterium]